MLFTTTTQFVALAVTLVAGWLLGLASHPGGRRWKQRYHDERDAHAGVRKDYEAKLSAANVRIKDLEAENTRLAKAAPVATPVAAPVAAPAPRPQAAATPAGYTRPRTDGWFNWNNRVGTNG